MPTINKQSLKKQPKRTGLAGRVKPLGDFSSYLKINLYGRSGTGKTTLWGTFPGRILAVICSSLKDPGELLSLNTEENRAKIDCVTLESSSEINEVVQLIRNGYETVVLDHATGLQELILKEVLGLKEIPAQLGWGIATQQQWGQVALQTKERLKQLLDLEANVVIVAQEREFNTETNENLPHTTSIAPYVASALSPSVVGWLNPACNYICETFIRQKLKEKKVTIGGKSKTKYIPIPGEVEYCLRTGPNDVYTTKFRIPKGNIPGVIVNPSYDKIMALLGGD